MLEIVQPARVKARVRDSLSRIAEEGLLIRPGEGLRTGLLFANLLLISAVAVMGRTVRDTLFLSRYPLTALPWMFVLYGVASAITVMVYTRLSSRLPRDRTLVVWCSLGIVTYLGTWSAVRWGAAWIYPAFYVWSEVFSNLALSQFWTLANELHDARSAKRLFGTVGSARVLGVIAVGLATGTIVRAVGTPQLLFVLAAILVAIAMLALRLGREPKPARSRPKGRVRAQKAAPSVLRDGYVWSLAAMLLLAFAAMTIGDYQFKAILRANFREDALAQFLSFFYAATGLVSFLFQIFATPRLLERFGVGVGMSVMPSVFGAASALLLAAPSLAFATLMKFADNGFQYTIHDTTLQSLYVPFATEVKVRARAFLDGVVKPFAYALGGLILIMAAAPLGSLRLGFISIALVSLWLSVIPVVRRRYLQRLSSTLRAGGLGMLGEEPVIDAGGRRALVQTLDADDPRLVLAALDEFDRTKEPEVMAALERLSRHGDPAIRIAALSRLGEHARESPPQSDDEAIRSALADAVPEVRAAAARAYARVYEDDAVDALVPLLDDANETVRGAALSGMLSHGGFEGAMVGGRRLSEQLASPSPDDRASAARAIGAIGRSGARRLLTLLVDEAPSVRLAAAVAAHDVRDPKLVPGLIDRLREPLTRGAAASALSAVGKPAIVQLAILLRDQREHREVRITVPRILRAIPCEASYAVLREAIADPDTRVRLRVYSAMSRLRESLGRGPEPLENVRAWVEREIRATLKLALSYHAARREIGTPLLDDAVDFSSQRGVRRVLRILELRYAPEPLRLVRDRLFVPARRANALEVLDTELESAMRPLVMPFFDDLPVEEKARRCGCQARLSGHELLRERLENSNPYSVFVALDAARTHRLPFARDAALELLSHPDPLVREGAVLTLAELDSAACHAALAPLTSDSDARVHRVARITLEKLSQGHSSEVSMYTTVEKLLILRATPLFSKLRGDDLAPLARVAEVQTCATGETIFEEGDAGDALYVVIRGKVAITKGKKTLATIERGDAFGEMSVLDEEPRSACATALETTDVLRIGSEEFSEVLHEKVEIAEGVIRLLSRRLREANEALERAGKVSRILDPAGE